MFGNLQMKLCYLLMHLVQLDLHIPGKSNVLADHLSRFNFQAAFQIAPHLKRQQTSVPSKFLTI